MPRPVFVRVFLLALLGGCRLIDQRTFEETGQAPSAAQVAQAGSLARSLHVDQPLLTVFPGAADTDWRPLVRAAVDQALLANPDARFAVMTPFPSAKDEAAQQAAVATGSADAAAVAGVMQAEGVAADHITLGARGDAGNPTRSVMVYAR